MTQGIANGINLGDRLHKDWLRNLNDIYLELQYKQYRNKIVGLIRKSKRPLPLLILRNFSKPQTVYERNKASDENVKCIRNEQVII